jgi:predicted nucleotidyltransferase/HEPN domain-containing protein
MKSSLEHLPESKRRELARVVEILFAEFQDAIVLGTQPHKRMGRILKVVLYGSYARGDWVNDPVGGYVSDYDLLVVVNHDRLTDMVEYWSKAEEHFLQEQTIAHRLTAPVSLIVHSFNDVNLQLKRGRPFFVDLIRDGIALYEAPGHEFDPPKPLEPAEALKEAQGYYEKWAPSAAAFQSMSKHAEREGSLNESAFALHQAVERLYHCVLLVLTLYSPKSHKLNFLRSHAEQLDMRLAEAWPRGTKFERRRFELLRCAYVDARYSPHYKISAEELAWLGERVTALQVAVNAVCTARLNTLSTGL